MHHEKTRTDIPEALKGQICPSEHGILDEFSLEKYDYTCGRFAGWLTAEVKRGHIAELLQQGFYVTMEDFLNEMINALINDKEFTPKSRNTRIVAERLVKGSCGADTPVLDTLENFKRFILEHNRVCDLSPDEIAPARNVIKFCEAIGASAHSEHQFRRVMTSSPHEFRD